MNKTLYNFEVEDRGILKEFDKGFKIGFEIGLKQGILQTKIDNANSLLDLLDDEILSSRLHLDIETVKQLRLESVH